MSIDPAPQAPVATDPVSTAAAATPTVDHGPPSWVTRRVMTVVAVVVLAADQLTKYAVRTQITLHDSIEIIPGLFNLVHVRNTGAAFGFLNSASIANKQLLMTAIALVALGAIALYATQVGSRETLSRAGLALILGGALGNLVDRASVGYVIDFVDVYWGSYHFWAFNVADSAITVGAALLILDMFVSGGNDVSTPV